MKRQIIFFILSMCSTFLYGQEKFNYTGFIVLNSSGAVYPYSLSFTKTNKTIKGFSTTNTGFPEETKNKIIGIYDKKNKFIEISEMVIIDTKSDKDLNTFCFLTMKLSKNKKELNGTFVGYFNDSTICEEGEVLLMKKKLVEKKIKKIKKQLNEEQLEKLNNITTENLKNEIIEEKKLTNNDIYSISLHSPFTLSIWDEKKEDGDSITILVNNKIILENFLIKNKKHNIEFEKIQEKTTIKIIANNIGSEPPNSVSIELIGQEKTYPIKARLEKAEFIILEIN